MCCENCCGNSFIGVIENGISYGTIKGNCHLLCDRLTVQAKLELATQGYC